MKKMKKLFVLPYILLLTLASCSGANDASSSEETSVPAVTNNTNTDNNTNNNNNNDVTPSTSTPSMNVVVPIEVDIDSSSLHKNGVNIKAVDVYDKDDHSISEIDVYVGYFDDLGLKFHVTYSDDSTEDFPLTYDIIPEQYIDLLSDVGTHTISLLFRGNKKDIVANVIESGAVRSITYCRYDGTVIKTCIVKFNTVLPQSEVPLVPTRKADSRFTYLAGAWDKDYGGKVIIDNDTVYPEYELAYKRYHNVITDPATSEDWKHRLLYQTTSIDYTTLYFHLTRAYRVPLYGYEVGSNVYHHYEDETYDPGEDSVHLERTFSFEESAKVGAIKTLFKNASNYTPFDPTGEISLFQGENARDNINPDNYIYRLSASENPEGKTITQLLNGNTTTKLHDDDKIHTIFGSYLNDGNAPYQEVYEASAYVYKNSTYGYYRLAVEADVDFILELHVSKPTVGDGVVLYGPGIIHTLVDMTSIETVIDFYRDGSEAKFTSTDENILTEEWLYDDAHIALDEGE